VLKKRLAALALIAVVVVPVAWTALMLYQQSPALPLAGLLHRSTVDPTVDRGGHSRGIVQVDLMRQIMADRARAVLAAAEQGDKARDRVPSLSHPLLGRPAPPFELKDSRGKTWKTQEAPTREPVILVFYLGQTCMACVTHLVELDFAIPRFRDLGAQVLAISADSPESSRQRLDRFGDFQVPLLSDPDHATALAYGVWKPLPGAEKDDGEPLHGTFIIDRDGLVRWAYVGDSPFRDVEALRAELASRERDRNLPSALPGSPR
jgi:peroxiredoxin